MSGGGEDPDPDIDKMVEVINTVRQSLRLLDSVPDGLIQLKDLYDKKKSEAHISQYEFEFLDDCYESLEEKYKLAEEEKKGLLQKIRIVEYDLRSSEARIDLYAKEVKRLEGVNDGLQEDLKIEKEKYNLFLKSMETHHLRVVKELDFLNAVKAYIKSEKLRDQVFLTGEHYMALMNFHQAHGRNVESFEELRTCVGPDIIETAFNSYFVAKAAAAKAEAEAAAAAAAAAAAEAAAAAAKRAANQDGDQDTSRWIVTYKRPRLGDQGESDPRSGKEGV